MDSPTSEPAAPPTTDAPTLRVSGVSQRFGDRLVLDGVDLDVPAGKVIGLLGPNGAGKTTLMRIIFGVLTADRGTVAWRGRPATAEDRRHWGYMPQERGLHRDMRVRDHLVWIARLHGLDRATARSRADTLLGRLGLADRGDDAIKNLSGGMAQRVQLAAAMVHEPELLVLDEPFAGLDPGAVAFLSGVIDEHVAAGRNLVLSSHQLDLVEDICESIVLVHRGRVVVHGGLRELKGRSPDRFLRVDVPVEEAWIAGAGATVASRTAATSRLRLDPGADPGAVLDRVRAHRPVSDFGVDTPTLSELFLAATGTSVDDTADAVPGDGGRDRSNGNDGSDPGGRAGWVAADDPRGPLGDERADTSTLTDRAGR